LALGVFGTTHENEINKQKNSPMSLERFIDAQNQAYYGTTETTYELALREIRNGRKNEHWIWFVFPQIVGLGGSQKANFYGIKDLAEAEAYLKHSVLGARLIEISSALLSLDELNLEIVVGHTDKMKIKSSMTLFSKVNDAHPIFKQVIDKFFSGMMDNQTLIKLMTNP
jgi:uncharacterized protein (DUF1810 family)